MSEWTKKTYPDGVVLEGEFKDDKLHGQGKITSVDGDVWEGEFKNGYLHGQGKKTEKPWKNGLIVYEGEFKKGELREGKKIQRWTTTVFGGLHEGEFKKGELHGKGKQTWPNGNVEEGEFVMGVFQPEEECYE